MVGHDLIERLIDDLEKSVRAKSIARNRKQLQADMVAYSKDFKKSPNFSMEEGWISLTCDITLPYDLGELSQVINYYEQLMPYKSGEKVDLSKFLNQVKSNKDKIAATFKKLIDSANLIVTFGQEQQTLFSYLKEKLYYLHNEALSVYNCYKRLTENKTA